MYRAIFFFHFSNKSFGIFSSDLIILMTVNKLLNDFDDIVFISHINQIFSNFLYGKYLKIIHVALVNDRIMNRSFVVN